MNGSIIKIVECPRDAMQGIHHFIPTEVKIDYINALLKVGFNTIDVGSFVSPKSIPQMRDTADVLTKLDLSTSFSKLLAIVANRRGAEDAVQFDEISFLGYPFSISETFQHRNTNSTIEESLQLITTLQELCLTNKKELVIYISMAFGNPYGDHWSAEYALGWIHRIASLGIKIIALADTVGVASKEAVGALFSRVVPEINKVEFGAHLHCSPSNWHDKLKAAFDGGCRRFDVAIKGYGGCPMANDELVGNLATENLVSFCEENNLTHGLNKLVLNDCLERSTMVFNPVTAI